MKKIILRISGHHSSSCEPNEKHIEFFTEGHIYNKNDIIYIRYLEGKMSDLPNVRTTVRIARNNVRMTRNGNKSDPGTLMVFTKNLRYEGLYYTAYGPFHMEIFTNRIVDSINKENLTGNLFIDYNIVLKGLSENHTRLYLEIYDADSDTISERHLKE